MGNAFFVVWRESLEAFLIIGILHAWLQANGDVGVGRRALGAGLAGGLTLALALGWGLVSVQDELTGEALELFQTGMLLVAAGLITQMVLWMRQHGRTIKARLHRNLTAATARSGHLGVAVVAALAVAREGAETVIFLYGLAQGGEYGALAIGTVAGLAAAGVTAWLAARGLGRFNLASLVRLSSILLLILASALLVAALDRLIGSGHLPPLVDPVWDSAFLVDDTTQGGKLIADFTGYRARPPLAGLLGWVAYWALVTFVWRRTARD